MTRAAVDFARERHAGQTWRMLEEMIPGSRVVELLRFELEALDESPPG